jgi:glucose/arabinose dehydrogenase
MRARLPIATVMMLGLLALAGWLVQRAGMVSWKDGLRVDTVAAALPRPWGLAFLPDGRMLVSLMAGEIRVLNPQGDTLGTLTPLPEVADVGQGGLLDVAVDPEFARQPWVYWSYAEPGQGAQRGLAGTAVARGRWLDGPKGPRLTQIQVIYRQQPMVRGSGHFGSRLVFDRQGMLFVTLGERQQDQPSAPDARFAQNLSVGLGKVVRITRDGQPAPGNPSWPVVAGPAPALPEIWSYGHRNPQGAALHPLTGELWLTEHGPQGGDELNRVKPGGNHGWPLVSYGCPYGSTPGEACRVAGGVHLPPMVEPLSTWVPLSIAPSGLAFYAADRFPQWRGHLFAGALRGQAVWDITLDGDKVVNRRPMLQARWGRIRDVRQGPDGWLYVLTDGAQGKLLRVGPLYTGW